MPGPPESPWSQTVGTRAVVTVPLAASIASPQGPMNKLYLSTYAQLPGTGIYRTDMNELNVSECYPLRQNNLHQIYTQIVAKKTESFVHSVDLPEFSTKS